MTGVYSGGLAYEYTMEANKYGVVEVSGNTVTELDDFGRLQRAFAATPNPSGDGGYNPNPKVSTCPPKSNSWNVTTDALPAIPEGAKKYMTEGAGTGVGLEGKGSQNAGGASTGTATAGSGKVTATAANAGASATKSGSASGLRPGQLEMAPFAVSAILLAFTGMGAFLL